MMNTTSTSTTPPHPQYLEDHREPHQPAQLPVGITENSTTNGDLIGAPPTIFDGNRSQTDHFITQFGLFRIINNTHAVITNPMRRVALALTYIRGPNVDAWVSQQFNVLSAKVFGDVNHTQTHTDTDEALWDDFITEFKRAYGETSWEVFAKLETLRMTRDDIEMYIATFENLLQRAECKREGVPMVHYFRQGLPTNLERSIVKRQTILNTLDEWQLSARKEVERRALMKAHHLGSERGDTEAAQTVAIRLSQMSEEERARLMTEGRCFECNEKGHLAQDCPGELGGEND